MCENSGPRGTRPVFSSTGMWCSPSITTASGRPERPWTLETKSFGFSAAESMYTRSPSRSYAARVDAAIWSAPMDRYRKTEAPMSHRRARASKPCARASFCTPWRETAAVAMTAADMAVARMTRSEISLSCGVASRSARNRKYTAARSQMREIALRVWEVWNGEVVMNRRPTVATIDAAMAKYRTPASASRAWASCASIPFTSAAAIRSGGATRSHPRVGLYAFGADSQFPQGDPGGPADEQVESRDGERVLEAPSVGGGRRAALPVGVERGLEPAREFGVLDDDADLAVLRRRPEAPVQAGHEHLTAVDDDPLVVEPLDGAARG